MLDLTEGGSGMDQQAVGGTTMTYWFGVASGVPYVYPGPGTTVVGAPVTVGLHSVFSGTPALPVTAGGANTGVWDFSANRTVRADFDNLLLQLESLGLKNGRLPLIRGWLAQA